MATEERVQIGQKNINAPRFFLVFIAVTIICLIPFLVAFFYLFAGIEIYGGPAREKQKWDIRGNKHSFLFNPGRAALVSFLVLVLQIAAFMRTLKAVYYYSGSPVFISLLILLFM
jgi:hypothetical protein